MNLFFSATTVLLMLLFKVVLSSVNSHTKIQKRRFNMQEFSSEGSEDASDKGDESDAIDDRYIDLISCKKETAASDMDLLQMMNRAKPATRQAKCLSACYLNKIGVVSYLCALSKMPRELTSGYIRTIFSLLCLVVDIIVF